MQESKYLAARDALAANFSLQERLQATLKQLEQGINANADQQAKIQAAAMQMNRSGWYSGLKAVGFSGMGKVGPKAIGPSRFWMTAGQVPEPNEDTKRLFEAYSYLPHSYALRRWTEEEDSELEKIILNAVQESAHIKFMHSVIQDNEQLTEEQLSAKMQEIAAIKAGDPGSEETALAFDPERWEEIATQHSSLRSGTECRIRWVNNLCPSARRPTVEGEAAWDKEEEAKLSRIATEHGERNWEQTAAELNNGWSAVQCLSRFRRLQSAMSCKPWSDAEVRQLQISYAQHAHKTSFWKAVAADLPGRTFNQCMHYWRNQMDRTVKKGRWSPHEDAALKAAVEVFGRKWARVAEAIPTRNQVQVRERWMNVLDPNLKRGKQWTPEEDAILVTALQECKNQDGSIRWADIARRLPGRTDDVVANHAITLRNFKLKTGAFKEKENAREDTKRKEQIAHEPASQQPQKRKRMSKKLSEGEENMAAASDHGAEPSTAKGRKKQRVAAGRSVAGRKKPPEARETERGEAEAGHQMQQLPIRTRTQKREAAKAQETIDAQAPTVIHARIKAAPKGRYKAEQDRSQSEPRSRPITRRGGAPNTAEDKVNSRSPRGKTPFLQTKKQPVRQQPARKGKAR